MVNSTNTALSDISRSLSLRQTILFTQKRLKTYFTDFKNLDLTINVNSQNQNHLKDSLYGIECFFKKFKNIIDILNDKNKEWAELQKTLSTDELKDELNIFQRFLLNDNFLEDFGKATDILMTLETKKLELCDLLKIHEPTQNQI